MKKKLFFFYFIFIFYILFLFNSNVYAADPKIVTTIKKAFEEIQGWILKFSFGDEEKIRTGKKLIKGSLFSYGFILAIDLILAAIKSLIG